MVHTAWKQGKRNKLSKNASLIGASMSEPHIGELNDGFSLISIVMYVIPYIFDAII